MSLYKHETKIFFRGTCLVRVRRRTKKNDFRSYCVIFLGQVLCRDGKAVELSAKLTPGNASERARIEAAGGWITEERFVCSTDLHVMAGLQNMLISYC